MTLTRRSALATTLMALIDAAQAQAPAPLKVVVPFGAGTTTDIVSRHVGEAIAAALGQPLVVDNKPGAGGTLGSDGVAKAPADGRTLLMGTVGTHAINPTLYRRLPYDALKDFVPIGLAGFTPTLLVVAANSPLKTVADLAAEAAKPAGVTFASAGNGTSGHLAGELLAARLGGRMVHVPYNQGGQALTDVMGGQVQFMFYHPRGRAAAPEAAASCARMGASSARRSAAAPEVAALQEQGVTDFDLVAWFMVYASAATPAADVAKLRDAMQRAMARPELIARLGDLGVESRALPACRTGSVRSAGDPPLGRGGSSIGGARRLRAAEPGPCPGPGGSTPVRVVDV
jgi:tripartite-type tricarboxylate transporter receptor subunit TctC